MGKAMTMQVGGTAPPFALPNKPGSVVEVGELIGKEKIVLLFFPLAYSSVCTAELCTIGEDWNAWSDLDARVFAISVDSPFVTEKFREDCSVPFPILSDLTRAVVPLYGVYDEEAAVAKRSVFVIGRDGRVAYVWVSDDPAVQPDYEAVKAAVRSA